MDPNEIQGFPLCIKPWHTGLGYTRIAFGNFSPDAIEINGHAFQLRWGVLHTSGPASSALVALRTLGQGVVDYVSLSGASFPKQKRCWCSGIRPPALSLPCDRGAIKG